jgi:hypothetical protein
MVTKKPAEQTAPATPPAKSDPNAFKVGIKETTSQALAKLATTSALSAVTLKSYSGAGDAMDLSDLVAAMDKAGNEVVNGSMGRLERILTNQALTLDAVFQCLAQRSIRQENLKSTEVFLRLALKAQAQCRSTAEALAEIKNPRPVQFVKQANISAGPQQVNNGLASRTGTFENEQNKLLEAQHGNNLDTRTQGAAGRVNPHLEAVGAVNRASDT